MATRCRVRRFGASWARPLLGQPPCERVLGWSASCSPVVEGRRRLPPCDRARRRRRRARPRPRSCRRPIRRRNRGSPSPAPADPSSGGLTWTVESFDGDGAPAVDLGLGRERRLCRRRRRHHRALAGRRRVDGAGERRQRRSARRLGRRRGRALRRRCRGDAELDRLGAALGRRRRDLEADAQRGHLARIGVGHGQRRRLYRRLPRALSLDRSR